jgi:hypothetical protein
MRPRLVRGGRAGLGIDDGVCEGALQRRYVLRIAHAVVGFARPRIEVRGCRTGSGRTCGAIRSKVLEIILCTPAVSIAVENADR